METNIKNTATLLHLSSLSQYFIPFGNFILPLIIWSTNKEKSDYVDAQGKQVINFQLSLFLYAVVLSLIAIPILFVTVLKNIPFNEIINDNDAAFNHFSFENITGIAVIALVAILIFFFMKIAEFFLVIYGSVRASNGEDFKYPLTLPFIK
ncbi:MAG: DUF4870 domain-containing protein [Bacteroidota bacterium]